MPALPLGRTSFAWCPPPSTFGHTANDGAGSLPVRHAPPGIESLSKGGTFLGEFTGGAPVLVTLAYLAMYSAVVYLPTGPPTETL